LIPSIHLPTQAPIPITNGSFANFNLQLFSGDGLSDPPMDRAVRSNPMQWLFNRHISAVGVLRLQCDSSLPIPVQSVPTVCC
jgi:hypothetical protein